jgi:signal transduction histidine kinase
MTRQGMPMPVYGPGRFLFAIISSATVIIFSWRFIKDLKAAQGIKRTELGFNALAAAAFAVVGLTLAHVIPALTGTRHVQQFLPLCALLYTGILAYGIVTRRIMSVSDVLRRITAYLLIAAYLVVVYLVVFWPTAILIRDIGHRGDFIAHLLAALAMAFSIAPAHGRMQRFANRLFINMQTMDTQKVIRDGQSIMTSIGTMDALLERFGTFICDASGTDRVIVLLKQDGYYRQHFPLDPEDPIILDSADGLIQQLREGRRPVSRDLLKRERPTPDREKAAATLSRFKVSVAIGINVNERLDGVLLLASRVSGRIYSANELDAIQIISNQLGTSVDNSRLYTALQDGKIYNDILVDSLVSGVIAVNAQKQVTVFNRQAQSLTGITTDAILNQAASQLPPVIHDVIDAALETKEGIRDRDETLGLDTENEVPVRLSSTAFHGTSGDVLGALVLLNDMRTVKQMEAQIRRSDRLSSIGTLAAGMAHEIKNPLVPIKTFTQLLPQQYEDAEFRQTFSDLVLREVGRIDSIVTRLLHFARPAAATLAPTSLEATVNDSLKLLEQQIRNRGIMLEKRFRANRDTIMGDKDLLSQAFVNFILNAIEAMDDGGTLTVSTSLIDAHGRRFLPGHRFVRKLIRVDIQDTGTGIDPEGLSKVFDPFFTTKSDGTGLGLAVSHGIIEEHGATVDVESQLNEGTTFHLLFELIEDRKPRQGGPVATKSETKTEAV